MIITIVFPFTDHNPICLLSDEYCSDLCVPISETSSQCACPKYRELMDDNSNCTGTILLISIHLSIYPYNIYLSIYLFIHLSMCVFIYQSVIYSFISLSIHPSIHSFLNPSIHLSIHLYNIYPSIYPSVYLFIYLSINISIHLSIYLSINISIYLFLTDLLCDYDFTCYDDSTCLPDSYLCDGIASCNDGSDEIQCTYTQTSQHNTLNNNQLLVVLLSV